MTSLAGLTHYPEGYGCVVATGQIDFGIRWRAGVLSPWGTGSRALSGALDTPWVMIDGDPSDRFPLHGSWPGVSVTAFMLEGLPIVQNVLPERPRGATPYYARKIRDSMGL